MNERVLELEVDLPLTPEDEEKYAAYVANGASEDQAWRQVAQDVLGHTGADVQGAEATQR